MARRRWTGPSYSSRNGPVITRRFNGDHDAAKAYIKGELPPEKATEVVVEVGYMEFLTKQHVEYKIGHHKVADPKYIKNRGKRFIIVHKASGQVFIHEKMPASHLVDRLSRPDRWDVYITDLEHQTTEEHLRDKAVIARTAKALETLRKRTESIEERNMQIVEKLMTGHLTYAEVLEELKAISGEAAALKERADTLISRITPLVEEPKVIAPAVTVKRRGRQAKAEVGLSLGDTQLNPPPVAKRGRKPKQTPALDPSIYMYENGQAKLEKISEEIFKFISKDETPVSLKEITEYSQKMFPGLVSVKSEKSFNKMITNAMDNYLKGKTITSPAFGVYTAIK